MKQCYVAWLCVFFFFAFGYSADLSKKTQFESHLNFSCLDDVNIDFEVGTIIFRSHDCDDETIEITDDYEVYVNGNRVETNRRQKIVTMS